MFGATAQPPCLNPTTSAKPIAKHNITMSNTPNPLLSVADFTHNPRVFKNPHWKPPTRRHKPAKAVLADEQRRLATLAAEFDKQESGAIAKNPTDAVTYSSLEAPPSLRPRKWWCDITGLEGRYKSVRHGLRYHNVEIFGIVQNLAPGVDQQYLELRNANVVLR